MAKTNYGNVVDLERYAKDSSLTEQSDGRVFDYQKMLELVRQLGRLFTDEYSFVTTDWIVCKKIYYSKAQMEMMLGDN